ncbi:MAG: extracellular solute-binding protein [Verrucomicrobia bacterium]|nr:extracellular solute-binding protein [Verrucomicrobiota bacterium]
MSCKTWEALCGWVLAAALAFTGCGESSPGPKETPQPKRAFYRGYGFWFQDLVQRFQKAANPAGQPRRYELIRLPDFDPLAPELYQQTALMLSSVYPMTELSFGARASEMLQAVDVLVANTAWVEEFARNGWLAPFDENTCGPMLREAGVEPVRAAGKGDDAKSLKIYGIPITRAADFLFYRKSYFRDADEARRAWAAGMSKAFPPKVPPIIAADGQEFFRFFLPLVWSLEPGWPQQTHNTFVVNTPAARAVLGAMRRSVRLTSWPSAANRMPFLVDLKQQVNSFTGEPRPFEPRRDEGPLTAPLPTGWLLSVWAQRILITAWGPPAPLADVGFFPLSVSTNAAAPGFSLGGGKCIVCSQQLASSDPGAQAAREVVTELVRYLLSEAGQRTLFYDQFEIPARRSLLKSLKDDDVAAVFGARREWCDYDAYVNEVRGGSRQMDERSRQFGRETLALLRGIEATMEDPARVNVRPAPLSINQTTQLDGFLHRVLAPSAGPPAGDAPPSDAAAMAEAERKFVEQSLAELQVLLEAEQRFIAAGAVAAGARKAASP